MFFHHVRRAPRASDNIIKDSTAHLRIFSWTHLLLSARNAGVLPIMAVQIATGVNMAQTNSLVLLPCFPTALDLEPDIGMVQYKGSARSKNGPDNILLKYNAGATLTSNSLPYLTHPRHQSN
jgi:hypothetical protein